MAAPWGLEEKPISCPAAGLTGNTLPLTNTAVCQRAREGRYSTSPIPSWPTPEMAGKAHRLIHLAQSPEWGDSKRLVVTPLSGCLFFSPLMSAVQQIFFFFFQLLSLLLYFELMRSETWPLRGSVSWTWQMIFYDWSGTGVWAEMNLAVQHVPGQHQSY